MAIITIAAKWITIGFGIYFICAGIMMLVKPNTARSILRKAGSANLINYTEITLRMIPAAGLIFYSEFSKFPEVFKIVGWFMLVTSLILYVVPRKYHHEFSVKCADVLKPLYFQLISPFSILAGCAIIYCVI